MVVLFFRSGRWGMFFGALIIAHVAFLQEAHAGAAAATVPQAAVKVAAAADMAIEAYQLGEDLSTWATMKTSKAKGAMATSAWASPNGTADVDVKTVNTSNYGFDRCASSQTGANGYAAKAVAEAWLVEGTFWDSTELRFPPDENWAVGEDIGKAISKSTGEFGMTGTKRAGFPWLKVLKRITTIVIDPPVDKDLASYMTIGAEYSDSQDNAQSLWSAEISLVWNNVNDQFDFNVNDPQGLLSTDDFVHSTYQDPTYGGMEVWELDGEKEFSWLVDISALPEDAEMNAWHADEIRCEVQGVPEPSTLVGLLGLCLTGLLVLSHRKR